MNSAISAKRQRLRVLLRATAAILILAMAGLIRVAVLFAQQSQMLRSDIERRVQLNGEIRQLLATQITLVNAETGQRGYLLTGRDLYFGPYVEAVKHLPEMDRSLASIAMSEPHLADRIHTIEQRADRKMSELAETIRLYDSNGKDDALRLMQSDAGEQDMQALRTEIGLSVDALQNERDATDQSIAVTNRYIERLEISSVSVLAGALLLSTTLTFMLASVRKREEAALAESERQHRAIVEEQSELISLAEPDGRLVYVNPAYARFFHQDVTEITGRNLFDWVGVDDREAVRAQLANVLRSRQPISGENRLVTPDGAEHWVSWTNRVQEGVDGQLLIHSVGRDITPQKLAEIALRASEDFLSRTGKVAGVGGWELDLNDGQVFWSEQVKATHEVAADFVPTLESAIGFYAPDAQSLIRRAVEEGRRYGRPWDLELPLITAEGRTIWVRAVGEAECDEAGEPVRLVGALQDITQRKKLEKALEENERFIYTITHNLPFRLSYIDRDLRFRFANKAVCERYDTPHQEIIGALVKDVAPVASTALISNALTGAQEGQPQVFEHEDEIDGVRRQMESRLIPDMGADGEVLGMFAVGIDITHLKSVERALRDLTEVFDTTSDFVLQTNDRGELQYLNPAMRAAVGLAEGAGLEGHVIDEFCTDETRVRLEQEILPALHEHSVWIGETTILVAEGRSIPASHMAIAHRDAAGRITRYSSIMRDITASVAARQQLARQAATLNAIIEAIPAMVAVWDSDLRYQWVNKAFERWRGRSRDGVIGRYVEEVVGPFEYERSLPWLKRAMAGETVAYEKEYPDADELRYLKVTYIPLAMEDGSVAGIIGTAQDITELRDEQKRLKFLSERDPLTGLLNRSGFEGYLKAKIEVGQGATLALLYIDLDHFKPINDQHGHVAGDKVLDQFALRLQSLCRPSDAVARLGGDEFAIVLAGVRVEENAHRVADKVIEAARKPFELDTASVTISASVGVAFNADEPGGWEGLLQRADAMTYRAKADGRGRRA